VGYRRLLALLLTLLIGVAATAPARADGEMGALRHGKHVTRSVEQALIVRSVRSDRHEHSGQRSSGQKSWLSGSRSAIRPTHAARRDASVRAVDTLPNHWGARHLTI
jgi:hypothetical protein